MEDLKYRSQRHVCSCLFIHVPADLWNVLACVAGAWKSVGTGKDGRARRRHARGEVYCYRSLHKAKKTVNKFGLELIELCHGFKLRILNGRTKGDRIGSLRKHPFLLSRSSPLGTKRP